jgi:hypothetical protein
VESFGRQHGKKNRSAIEKALNYGRSALFGAAALAGGYAAGEQQTGREQHDVVAESTQAHMPKPDSINDALSADEAEYLGINMHKWRRSRSSGHIEDRRNEPAMTAQEATNVSDVLADMAAKDSVPESETLPPSPFDAVLEKTVEHIRANVEHKQIMFDTTPVSEQGTLHKAAAPLPEPEMYGGSAAVIPGTIDPTVDANGWMDHPPTRKNTGGGHADPARHHQKNP